MAGSSGLSFAAQVDPNTGAQTPVVSQIFYLFLLVLFTSTDVILVAKNFVGLYRILPIGVTPSFEIFISAGIQAAGTMFFAASIIMLPFAIILLLTNVSIGIITRSAPSLNLFSIGFPITLIGIFFVYISQQHP